MPIASAAAWQRSGSIHSSRSSLETPHSNNINNGDSRSRLRHNGISSSQDDFYENNNHVPSSIKEYAKNQPSHLESSDSVREDSTEEERSWLQQKCGEIVDDEWTQLFILILIAANSIMYGAATFPAIKDNPNIIGKFETVDLIVLIIFTIESILQFVFNGARRFVKDGWLVFDVIIVVISWVSVEIDELRAFRVFRALRFVTRVSILRNVIVALFSIVPAITAIFTLLLLIFYIFSVMFTALFKDMYTEGHTQADYFGRLDYSLFTLFQILCLVRFCLFLLDGSMSYTRFNYSTLISNFCSYCRMNGRRLQLRLQRYTTGHG